MRLRGASLSLTRCFSNFLALSSRDRFACSGDECGFAVRRSPLIHRRTRANLASAGGATGPRRRT